MRIIGAHPRRASQAIALNIAEGNGKATSADRRQSFEIA
ncbi:MAG: four helix bundle protein [Thiohalocapsa sp. PB-PSB1]|nr:MAG: four helix bundle protein [Thiohalocapsa sp. PB-PSB1]